MKLYIIRHGETAWNVEGRLQGQTDTELNENGVRLAKVTAEGLKNIPFDLGISSPLRRAKHTAELVLAGRNVPLTTDDRLMELSFGSWEGLGCRANNFEIPSEHFDDFTEIRSTSARRETERRSRRSATGQKRSIMS